MSSPAVRAFTVFLHLILLAAPLAGFAEVSPTTPPPAEMETVTVTGRPEDRLSGSNTLSRETLNHLPMRNGSINEAIGILPGVQLPELGRTSIDAGEILPPKLSISGGKSYLNNFLIDGISNNSLIDPEREDPVSFTLVPGHPQSLFLDTDLVEQIQVYRYNVPARFGSFTGGVVDAKTREPGPEFWGEATYRTTRHEWTQFHVDPTIKGEFENSTSQKYQPEFEKHDVGLLLNTPLTSRLSLLTSYQLNYSRIPVYHILDEKVLTRSNENFFAKLAYDLDAHTRITATLQHAPYQADYVYPNSLGGEFTIEGGGDQIGLRFEHAAEWGTLSLTGAGKNSENDRDASGDFYTRATTANGRPGDKPWGTQVGSTTPGYPSRTSILNSKLPSSYEGNVGSLETSQSGFEVVGDVQAEPFATGPLIHQLNAGFAFEQATGMMKRSEAHNAYSIPVITASSFICPPGLAGCIDGQQFMSNWQHYAPEKVRATINLYDGYGENLITWNRLKLRPGVRVSYDDFMENTNISPRLAASYDLFGDEQTVLVGGLNRYYGRALLTYKLREASSPVANYLMTATSRRTGTPAWPANPTSTGRPFRYSELDTPYSDEIVLGLDQELLGGRLKVTGLQREGRDEFSQDTFEEAQAGGGIKRYYQLTNRGESHHQQASLEWERSWENHYVAINATWQETETNNETYATSIEDDNLFDVYWYEGDYISIDELPRRNYNRNWTGNLIYSARLPLGFTFTNVTRYRSGYEALVLQTSAQKAALGIPPTVIAYSNEDFSDALVFDWRFDWDMFRDQSLVTSLEVNNVFDEEVEIGDPSNRNSSNSSTYVQNYELGRQVWLGLTYKF